MDNLKLYEINGGYITYLSAYAPHLFQNKKSGQKNERKYIGSEASGKIKELLISNF